MPGQEPRPLCPSCAGNALNTSNFTRRHRGPRPLADFVAPGISDLCGRAGFSVVEVVTHWDEIVGPDLAPRCIPLKLQWPREEGAAATLVVRVEGAYAIELQYAAGIVVERINAYFGWRCVGRLLLRQGPVPQRHTPPPVPPKPDKATVAAVRHEIGAFEDEALADSLARLGALVRRERGGG